MKKFLIVEDDEYLIEEILLILQLSKFEVISTNNGIDGLRLARETLPDLILCDILMPGLDGFDVLREIHLDSQINDIPFIFLTAKAEREALRQGMEIGADDYLTKPFTHLELLSAVRTQLEKRHNLKITQLRAVSQELIETQDKERFRIAHELQEKVGQILQSAGVMLSISKYGMDENTSARLQEIHTLIDHAAAHLNELSMDLHPILLDHLGLLPALNWYLDRYKHQQRRNISLNPTNLEGQRLSPEVEKTTYRLTQEYLVNLVPELNLDNLKIDLQLDSNYLQLKITGSTPTGTEESLDQNPRLLRLYERAFALGGNVSLKFLTEEILCLTVHLPLNPVASIGLLPANSARFLSIATISQTTAPPIPVIVVGRDENMRLGLRKMLESVPDIRAIKEEKSLELVEALCRSLNSCIVLLAIDNDLGTLELHKFLSDLAEVKVLVVSNNLSETTAIQALRNGVAGYILAEAGAEELVNAIRQVQAGRRYLGLPFLDQAIEFYANLIRSDNHQPGYDSLTRREKEMLTWIAAGYTSAEIAEKLALSPRTVETHRANIMSKLNLHNRNDLTRFATLYGLQKPVIELNVNTK